MHRTLIKHTWICIFLAPTNYLSAEIPAIPPSSLSSGVFLRVKFVQSCVAAELNKSCCWCTTKIYLNTKINTLILKMLGLYFHISATRGQTLVCSVYLPSLTCKYVYMYKTGVGSWQSPLCIALGYAEGNRGQNAASLCLCVCLTIVNRDTRRMQCHHLSPLSLPPHQSVSPVLPQPPPISLTLSRVHWPSWRLSPSPPQHSPQLVKHVS